MGRGLHVAVILMIVELLAACSPRTLRKGKDASGASASSAGANADKPAAAAADEQAEASLRGKAFQPVPELATIRFDYDRYELGEEARRVLRTNAAWLREHKEVEIQVEGHCDERGTTAYNVALGQKRAASVRDYYKLLGMKMKRMSTISYGEEKPECAESTEDCWRRNRRAMTLIRRT